jgi:hypothetical protein
MAIPLLPVWNPLWTSIPFLHNYSSESASELLYDWRFTPVSSSWRQAPWDSRPAFFFQLNTCFHSPYVTSSLARGWVCRLQLLLAFASTVFHRSDSRATRDHIVLSQIRDSFNLEGQVPVFTIVLTMLASVVLLITPMHEPSRNAVSNSTSIVACAQQPTHFGMSSTLLSTMICKSHLS